MKLKFNLETIYFLLIEKRLIALLLAIFILIIVIAVSGASYFISKQKSSLSAQIAVGLANLEVGKNDVALVYFQNVFNKSDGLYGVVAAAGVVQSLEKNQNYDAKIHNVINIIKDYKSPTFIKMFVLSSYLGNISHFTKRDFNQNDFVKLQKFADTKGEAFQPIIQNISLNINLK